ncbi:MAG: flippase [Candidatus Staskawiczbacteria bacterium]|nr:flippase [Candidatus Staskawiczbacteria bacterium]
MKLNIKSLFLENIGTRQTIFKNTFWLIIAEVFSRFLEIILVIYIVRVLGAAEFGKFAFAMAVASMFVSFSGLGLSEIVTREIAYNQDAEKEYPAVLSFKIILGIGIFFLAIAASFFITQDPLIRLIIMALTVFYFFNDIFSIIYAFLRAHQKMEYEAGFKTARSLILIMVVSLVIFKAPSIQNISYGYTVANFLALIAVLVFFHTRFYPLKLSFDGPIWRKFFQLSWPLGLAAIFGAIFINIDSVIMGYLGQTMQNGWYGAARKAVGIIIIPATLVFMSFYPMASKLFKESGKALQKMWDYYMALMIILAFPIIAGGFVMAPKLMSLLYGPGFEPSIPLFQMLIFIAGINFIYYPYALILIVSGQQKKYLFGHAMGAVVNVVLNIILIPRYGPHGAAISAVVTYIILLLSVVTLSRYTTPISIFSRQLCILLSITMLSSLIMFAIVNQLLIYNANIFYLVSIGTLTYFSVFLSCCMVFKKYNNVIE